MNHGIEKDRKEAQDLSTYYRPIALKAILAAFSIVGTKADPVPSTLQWHPDSHGFEED